PSAPGSAAPRPRADRRDVTSTRSSSPAATSSRRRGSGKSWWLLTRAACCRRDRDSDAPRSVLCSGCGGPSPTRTPANSISCTPPSWLGGARMPLYKFNRHKFTRRAFIPLRGSPAAAGPLAAGAQQREPMRRIGVLSPTAMDDQQDKERLAAFQQRLQQLGWSDGHNVRIDHRFAAADPENYRKYAAELVALAPDVIL